MTVFGTYFWPLYKNENKKLGQSYSKLKRLNSNSSFKSFRAVWKLMNKTSEMVRRPTYKIMVHSTSKTSTIRQVEQIYADLAKIG